MLLILQVVSQGAISAPMYSLKGPSMIESLYPTAFPLKHQQKVFNFPCTVNFFTVTDIYISHNVWLLQDLRLALGLAESVSQSTPIAAAANELYKVAKSHGLSDEDFSAVIEALKAKKWLQWWKLFFVRANTSTCLQFLTDLIIIIVPFKKFSPKCIYLF